MISRSSVSICMITYNHENYIREAIEGVLMQICDIDLELIVSNDCSVDSTDTVIHDILQNHPKASKIKYISHKKNLGMMPNFIQTLEQCKGKYIALCEGDDYWTDPFKLQKQIDFLEENEECILTFHHVDVLRVDGNLEKEAVLKVPDGYENLETLVLKGNYIHTPSVVFKNIIKNFPFEINFAPFGDFFLYFMLAEKGKFFYFKETMAVYRKGIGVLSKMTRLDIANNNVLLYSCMISYTRNENIKKLLFQRQLEVGTEHYNEKIIPSYVFASNHKIFRWLKVMKDNSQNPAVLWKKLKRKIYH